MEEFELYSCEELWDFFKEGFFQLIENNWNLEKKYEKEVLKGKTFNIWCEKEKTDFKNWIIKNYSDTILTFYEKFKGIYNKLQKQHVNKKTILYSDYSYEILICFLPDDMSNIQKDLSFSNASNDIQFTIKDYSSEEFSLLMLNHLKSIFANSPKIKEQNETILSQFTISSIQQEEPNNICPEKITLNLDINTYPSYAHNIYESMQITKRHLCITTKEKKTFQELQYIYNSVSFEIMYQYNCFPFESYLKRSPIN